MFRADTDCGTVELPLLDTLPLNAALAVFDADERNRVWVLLEMQAQPDTLAVFDRLPSAKLNGLFLAWESASGVRVPELMQMMAIIKKHSEALEADLINAGLRLRDCPSERFTWRDLKVFIRYMPPTGNLYGAMYPDKAGWDKPSYLLAEVVDSLHWLQWAKTKDGRDGRNRPKLVPRPGVTPPRREGSNPAALPLSELKKRLAARQPSAADLNELFAGRK